MDKKILAIDLETTGLDFSCSILSIAAAWRGATGIERKSWLVQGGDLFHTQVPTGQVIHELTVLIDQADVVTLHNASFDLSYLFKQGILFPSQLERKLFDTLLTARMTGPRESVGLASLCNEYKLADGYWLSLKAQSAHPTKMGTENLLKYNEMDAEKTLQLAEILWQESVNTYGEAFTLRESSFCNLMAEITCLGKELDRDATRDLLIEEKTKQRFVLREMLWPRQIKSANDKTGLIRWLRLKGYAETDFFYTDKGNVEADHDALEQMVQLTPDGEVKEILTGVLLVRKSEKLCNTYLEPFLSDQSDALDLIHPHYTVGGTVTYRLSSSHPNGQNIPRELVNRIWSPFISADYSQAELRVGAAFAKELNLARVFEEGLDVHLYTSKEMFGEAKAKEMRPTAKNINFSTIYGGGAQTVHKRYGIPFDVAQDFIRRHKVIYPNLHKQMRVAMQLWKDRGYLVLPTSGKRIYATRDDLERGYKGFNNVVQGTVGELVKEAMLQLHTAGVPIIGQIHDSIEFPLGVDQDHIRSVMEGVFPENLSKRTNPNIVMRVDIDEKGVGSDKEQAEKPKPRSTRERKP